MRKIDLVEMTEPLREAFRQGRQQLAIVLDLAVPEGWPEYPDIMRGRAVPNWPFFLFVDAQATSILGSGGFLCAPDRKGEVQIGYEVAPAFRGQGVATAAMRQVLTRRGQAVPIAGTHAQAGPSVSVLRKLGFSGIGTHTLPDDTNIWMWTLRPDAVMPAQVDQLL